MGLSKRNPRGNFSYQSRYLKRKAINCGQLDVPFDCSIPELQPVLEPDTVESFCTGTAKFIAWTNSGVNQTTGNNFTIYKDGVFFTELLNHGSLASIRVSLNMTLADEGVYECVCVNIFGCQASSTITLNGVETPEITFVKTQSTIPCVDPNPAAPPPILGDGSVDFTITNFDPSYTYGYTFTYDPGVVNYSITNNSLTTATFTIADLCNIRFFLQIYVVGSSPLCSNTYIVDLTTP